MKKNLTFITILILCISSIFSGRAQDNPSEIFDEKVSEIYQEVVEWRHHLHRYPELSNREVNTSAYVKEYLEELGLEVESGIAHTGVVGLLRTGKPGPTIGIRADMDGLPVVERVDLPYASKERTQFLGEDVGIMHACGHDTHVAMLMGAARILTDMKEELTGNILFIFQPAEEGAPPGEEGGAKLMVKEGLLEKYGVEVIFGQHISSDYHVGVITYKIGGSMAAADRFVIKVKGKQTHGSKPWKGIDPITISAQIIQGLNNIVSRQTELTKEAAVISIGKIKGGFRNNIIPEEVEMIGTIRTLDTEMQENIHARIRQTAMLIAESAGATAEVDIQIGVPVTFNDLELTRKMLPSLYKAAGEENVHVVAARTGAEDFSYFANEIPGMFFFTGGTPKEVKLEDAAPHHTPDFYVEDAGMITGMKALCQLAYDYLTEK
jgi:amidohydrolase